MDIFICHAGDPFANSLVSENVKVKINSEIVWENYNDHMTSHIETLQKMRNLKHISEKENVKCSCPMHYKNEVKIRYCGAGYFTSSSCNISRQKNIKICSGLLNSWNLYISPHNYIKGQMWGKSTFLSSEHARN